MGIEAFTSSGPPIFSGQKTLSIRNYPLPNELVGKPLVALGGDEGYPLTGVIVRCNSRFQGGVLGTCWTT